ARHRRRRTRVRAGRRGVEPSGYASNGAAPGLPPGPTRFNRRDLGDVSGKRLEPRLEATRVALLGAGERLEPLGDLLEALVTGGLREARVHLGVLVGLARDRGLQVVVGGADRFTRDRVADLGEEVEVTERVAGLTFGDRAEQCRDVGVTLDVGLLREVEV